MNDESMQKKVYMLGVMLETKTGQKYRRVVLTASDLNEIDRKLDDWLYYTRQKATSVITGYEILKRIGEQGPKMQAA